MSTHPNTVGSGSPAKIKPILIIKGFWPLYETALHCLGKPSEWRKHFGKKALTSYLVEKRLEEEHAIKDYRKYWK